MPHRLIRAALALVAPLLLASCVLTPGRFVSTLIINADRSFSFSYVGEVANSEPDGDSGSSLVDDSATDTDATGTDGAGTNRTGSGKLSAADIARKKAKTDADNRQLAATLSKEAGYRKVSYIGNGVFMIDYAIKGRLDHLFVWPFNVDAEAILPFVAIELRQDGVVRMKAPAFASQQSATSSLNDIATNRSSAITLDGKFTLDTDAVIVSQNNEDGVEAAGNRRTITWHATPALKSPPTAVLKLAVPAS